MSNVYYNKKIKKCIHRLYTPRTGDGGRSKSVYRKNKLLALQKEMTQLSGANMSRRPGSGPRGRSP